MAHMNQSPDKPFPVCRICDTARPGWDLFDRFEIVHIGDIPRPHWGLSHLCRPCWEQLRKWTTWTEHDIIAAFPDNPHAVISAFWLTNRLRKAENERRRAKKSRVLTSERTPSRYKRYRPLLRQYVLKDLGYAL